MTSFLLTLMMADQRSASPIMEPAKPRTCTICKTRMSALQHDKHTLCVSCRGGECAEGNKCNECLPWSEEEFSRYLKHRKTLDVKAKSKSKMAKLKSKGKGECDNNSESGASAISDDAATLSQSVSCKKGEVVAKSSGESLSKHDIVSLINESIGSFSQTFKEEVSLAMTGAFKEIASTLDRRLGPEEDDDIDVTTNPSFSDNPSLAPVEQSLGRGRPDPPALTPYQRTGSPRGEHVGPEQESLPDNPLTVQCFLQSLARQGIHVSDELFNAANSWGSSQGSVRSQGGTQSGTVREGAIGVSSSSRVATSTAGSSSGSSSTALRSHGSTSVGEGTSLGTSKSVSFGDSLETGGDDDDHDDQGPPSASSSDKRFTEILKWVFEYHREELSIPEPKTPKMCGLEKYFKVSSSDSKTDLNLNLYHRVSEVLDDVRSRFKTALENSKPILGALGYRKKKYESLDFPSLGSPPTVNSNLTRIMPAVSTKRSISLSYDEASRMESLSRNQLELHSNVFWLLSTLLAVVKENGFTPPDSSKFEDLISELSLSLVHSTNQAASIATFLQTKRREGLLAHLPCHVAACHKTDLLTSPLDSSSLFGQEVLDKVIRDVHQDSHTDAQLAISKAVSLPSFSSFRSSRKSEGQVEKGNSSQGSYRGRGRGGRGGFGSFSSQKRKEPPSQTPNAKSPRRGGRSPRGRGFPK